MSRELVFRLWLKSMPQPVKWTTAFPPMKSLCPFPPPYVMLTSLSLPSTPRRIVFHQLFPQWTHYPGANLGPAPGSRYFAHPLPLFNHSFANTYKYDPAYRSSVLLNLKFDPRFLSLLPVVFPVPPWGDDILCADDPVNALVVYVHRLTNIYPPHLAAGELTTFIPIFPYLLSSRNLVPLPPGPRGHFAFCPVPRMPIRSIHTQSFSKYRLLSLVSLVYLDITIFLLSTRGT